MAVNSKGDGMKKLFATIILAGLWVTAQAQGTLQFSATLSGANENPPNGSVLMGKGTFSLVGNSLDFAVLLQAITTPASGGVFDTSNSLVFDLGTPLINAPGPTGQPGSTSYTGTLDLTSQEISALRSGAWHVNILTSAYPNGEISGQIAPVPEPSILALFSLLPFFLAYRQVKGREQGSH